MKYISTRDKNINKTQYSSAEVIKKGLADDKGLFLPENFVSVDSKFIDEIVQMSYSERAVKILGLYLDDYTEEELKNSCSSAYSQEKFGCNPAYLKKLDGNKYILELWHGPTCAFKDMALQIMPHLLSKALGKTNEAKNALILVATSGDTGKAALEGYKDTERLGITVFFPSDGVSDIQKLQMTTQEGTNVDVCAVDGNFDDCQTGVKKIFADSETVRYLHEKNIFLSSANSINWGRLIPQVVYYFSAYADMIKSGAIINGEIIDITVPTGNFGNIFAAFIAKKMGLPIDTLVCASNSNNILTDFLNTGVYDRNRNFHSTISPSMDILISSNLERLLYVMGGAEENAGYMNDLEICGKYEVSKLLKSELDNHFKAYFCDEENTKSTIKNTFERINYLSDPHTAVALYCSDKYINESASDRKMLIASTASPYKFAKDVYMSLQNSESEKIANDSRNEFEVMDCLSKITDTEIPKQLKILKDKTIRFTHTVKSHEMNKYIKGKFNF